MLESVKTYIYDRRNGLSKTAGVVGGLYVAKRYISDRLEEVKDKMEQERSARDNLKRRFRQTHDDVSFTVLALLPTLADQVLEEMDVEQLTRELQSRAKRPVQKNVLSQIQSRPPASPSLASSTDIVHDQDMRSDSASNASTSFSAAEDDNRNSPSNMSTSGLQNWVETSGSRSVGAPSEAEGVQALSESFVTTSSSIEGSGMSESYMNTSIISAASDSSSSRSKTELWNEVKMLTFTRTLTTLYSATLLCLFTTIQLTLLARSKYVSSVLQQEQDERMRERLESQLTMVNLLFGLGRGKGIQDLMSLADDDGGGHEASELDGISEEVESRFLTLSWWLLHVGWKDVGERVRRGVEEVFDGVSLKSRLSVMDVHRLVSDVRRRVEHEITFEGTERRINFLSTLLPPTPETIQHVLAQGGFPSNITEQPAVPDIESSTSLESSQLSQDFVLGFSEPIPPHPQHAHSSSVSYSTQYSMAAHMPHPYAQDPAFNALVDEARSVLCSSDFARVLEVCLDRATEVLFNGLEKSVFAPQADVAAPGEDVRIRLASLLPGLARWSHLALNGLPNELVDTLLDVREVSCLSAIAFAKFEEQFR
ncbi:Peroxin-3-domain-containing protein [Crucibulum laeve]|uniref:Peroxin-3-domain-containing protein n=1 Tax=Crucibulum laeve TaxID=68775 RepID=A0A5C3LI93_9AGAR|nr:Peroxin-3-domain-containing protein [Crucibulum laeve]